MKGADTNLLVRHFTQDDASQAALVQRFFENAAQDHEAIYVSDVVLCELCWVVGYTYKLPRADIRTMVRALLDDPLFALDRRDEVERALIRYEKHGGDFPDHLIAAIAETAQAAPTYTFDRKAAKLPGFTLLH